MRSNVHRIGATRRAADAGSIGVLPIPDARLWPAEIREWYRNAAGDCGPLDVFIFSSGQVGSMYLQDAITAAAVMRVDASEWHTERGFPAFIFDAGRTDEIRHRLDQCGYTVHVLDPTAKQKRPSKRRGAPVVSIDFVRGTEKGTKTK
jgi:hypothetical protein